MIDIRKIRDDPEGIRKALARRGTTPPIDELLETDASRRLLQTRLDEARAEQKRAGRDVAKLSGDEKDRLLARLKTLSDEVTDLEAEIGTVAAAMNRLLLEIPNVPHESVPDGTSDDDNVEVRRWGEPAAFGFEARDHLDIGETLDVIDVQRAARASGSRFGYLKGDGALLWLALVRFAFERLAAEGFTPVVPPVLVRREAMEATGFLPTDEQQIYKMPEDDLYLVGTSEVPLAALHMGDILDPAGLPLRYAALSSCFRREAGAHGRDTRGIFRTHQFEKVEMYVFCRAEDSWDWHDRMVALEESILQALAIPYRTVNVCAAELGPAAAKKIDLEAWFPAQERYRELTSCSNTTDYQARRLNCRIRSERGPELVHTLNGTVVTSSRFIPAILENNQRADGTVAVPDALRPFCGFESIGRPAPPA